MPSKLTLAKPYQLTAPDKECVSWMTNSGIQDLQWRLKDMTGTPRDIAVLTAAIAIEGKNSSGGRSSRLKPMEAALRKFTKTAGVKPLDLAGESKLPDWTRARGILEGIKHHFRLSLAGRIILGQELLLLKTELGFCGRGGDRSKPQNAVLKSSVLKTWADHCKAGLGISDDKADRIIGCYEGAKAKLKRLGNMPRLLSLLETSPAKLDDEARKTLAALVDGNEWGATVNELLEEFKILKRNATTTGGNTSNGKPKKTEQKVEQLAFAFFGKATDTVLKVDKAVSNLLASPDYKGYMAALPLHRSGGPDEISLHVIKATLEAALAGDLPKLLADVNKEIAAREARAKDAA